MVVSGIDQASPCSERRSEPWFVGAGKVEATISERAIRLQPGELSTWPAACVTASPTLARRLFNEDDIVAIP